MLDRAEKSRCVRINMHPLSVNRRKYEGSAVGELVLWLALNTEHAIPEALII